MLGSQGHEKGWLELSCAELHFVSVVARALRMQVSSLYEIEIKYKPLAVAARWFLYYRA